VQLARAVHLVGEGRSASAVATTIDTTRSGIKKRDNQNQRSEPYGRLSGANGVLGLEQLMGLRGLLGWYSLMGFRGLFALMRLRGFAGLPRERVSFFERETAS
jgi:hypothetical protein